EVLIETFGLRVVGLQIGRYGDGMNHETRLCRSGHLQVYNIGRSYLLELFLAELNSDRVRFVSSKDTLLAFEQLVNLEVELRDAGTVYTCPPGRHDDLGMSLAMLAWAAQHPHL